MFKSAVINHCVSERYKKLLLRVGTQTWASPLFYPFKMLCIHWLPVCGCTATRLMDRRWAVFVAQLLSFYGLFSTWKSCPLASSSSIPTGKYKPHCLPKDAPLWETHDSFTAWPLCSTTPTWVRPVPSHSTSTQGTIKPCWGPAGLHSIALGRFWYHHSLPSASWASLLEAPVRAPIQAGSYCPSPKVPPRSECMEHGALPSKNWVDAVCLSVNTSSNEVFKITLQIDQQIDHIHVVTTMGQGLWLWWRH